MALQKFKSVPLSEIGFLDCIKEKFPNFYESIQWVKFYFWKDSKREWRIAVINTPFNYEIRNHLYHLREEITILSGWYPLVQGARAPLDELPKLTKEPIERYLDIGLIKEFRAINYTDKYGSSFEIKGTKGSLILDFGLKYEYQARNRILAGFLTHFHNDHSDGVIQFIKLNQRPIIMSKGTFAYLYQYYCGKPERTLLSLFSRIISSEKMFVVKSGARISTFPVYHCPGSIGLSYLDEKGRAIIYPGDICLANAFNNFIKKTVDIINLKSGEKTVIVLDASMVQRKDQEISIDDNPSRILNQTSNALKTRNVFIVTTEGESMVYTYLLAFENLIRDGIRTPILVPQYLLIHLYVLWDSILKVHGRFKDPVLKSGKNAISLNFAETQQLYPINSKTLSSIPHDKPQLVFSDLSFLESYPEICKRIPNSDIILVGALALREDIPDIILKQKPRQILRVASSDWSFHSNENDLEKICRYCTDRNIRIYLFHNYSKRIKNFIKKYNLPLGKIYCGDKKIIF